MTAIARVGSFLLSVIVGIALVTNAATATGVPQTVKRVVRIGVLNPTAGVAESQVSTHDGEPCSFKIDDVGSFKLLPNISKSDAKAVQLTILDADSGKQIDQLQLSVGGKAVQPKGLPFQLKIIEVTTPK
jgi:hypothetical protein